MKTMILYAFLTYMMPSGAIYYEFSALMQNYWMPSMGTTSYLNYNHI